MKKSKKLKELLAKKEELSIELGNLYWEFDGTTNKKLQNSISRDISRTLDEMEEVKEYIDELTE